MSERSTVVGSVLADPTTSTPVPRAEVRDGVGIVGRAREVELVMAALDAGAHIVLEGPPGTGKTTLLRSVADEVSPTRQD